LELKSEILKCGLRDRSQIDRITNSDQFSEILSLGRMKQKKSGVVSCSDGCGLITYIIIYLAYIDNIIIIDNISLHYVFYAFIIIITNKIYK